MRALAFFSIFLFSVSVHAAVLSDSTSIVKNQPDSITKKVVSLLIKANELSVKKPWEAIKSYRTALTTNKVKDEIWEAHIRVAMGKLLSRVKSKDALPQLVKADAIFKKKNILNGRVAAIEAIAQHQERNGQFDSALRNYNELYRIQNKIGLSVEAGNTASHLTDVFTRRKDYTQAFKYADMAKNAYYKVCRMDSLGSIYYKIASLKLKLKSPKLAEYYILNHALPYYRSSDDLNGRLKSFDFLGHLYQDQKRYSEAKWFYLQANNQAKVISDTSATITSLINLGVVKYLIGDLSLAKQDISEAELLAQGDSTNMQLVKRARMRYTTMFKKLDSPVIASNTAVKKAASPAKASQKKTAGKKVSDAVLTDNEKREKPEVDNSSDK